MTFKGEIAEIPVGIDGLTGTKNLTQVGPGHLIMAENITYESGTVGKEGGSAKYSDAAITGTPEVLGGWDWHPAVATQRNIILCDDGKLYKDDGLGNIDAVTLKSGLTVSSGSPATITVPVFVEGGNEVAANNRKLFLFTGKNAIQVLSADSATTTDISKPPADWSSTNQPTFGLIHENRMVGGGNANDPHRLYLSLPTDHEDFTTTPLTLSIYPGDGERLTGAVSFKGVIVCWKYPKGIYLVDTSNSDTSLWRITKHSTSIGGISPLGHVPIDDDVIFIDSGLNLHLISAIQEFGNIGSKNLSDIAQLTPLLRDEINIAQLANTQVIYYVAKREVHFTMTSTGTIYDRSLIVDFNRPGLPRFRISNKDTARSIWLATDSDGIERPRIGDQVGEVWTLDQDSRSKNGAGYNGQFQTAYLDFSHLDPGLGTINKNGKFLELVVEPKGNWDLSVDILWDGSITDTILFSMGATSGTLGTFVLGTDQLGGTLLSNKRRRIAGAGRRLSLIGRNSGNGENFSVAKFYLGFTRGSSRNAS